jgi:Mrp family chromosome partitioning ATPase
MAAERSASSRQQSYADQYLGRGAQPQDPQADPYGYWYAERLRRSGGVGETAPHRQEPSRTGGAPETDPSNTPPDQSEPFVDPSETAAQPEAEPVEPAQVAGFSTPDFGPEFVGPAPERAPEEERPPEARAPVASFSPAVLRQLEQNQSQLSLVEGNLVAAAQSEVSSIYITSCFRGEGKTTAALSTVYGLCALSQARVLLVDGGNNAARLHSMLSMASYPGFNEVIEGRVDLSDALHPVSGMPGLHVLACGAVDHAMLSEARRVDRIRAFLARVKPHYDFVVVDGGAALSSSDPARLASCFDGMVFVVACERTKWEVLQGAVEKVRNGGGQVLGGVLNRRRFYVPRLIYQWISR